MVCRRWRPNLTVRFAARAGFTSVGLRSGLAVREPFGTAMRLITLTRLLRRVDRPDHLRGDSTRVLPIHVEIRVAVGRRTGDQHPEGPRRDGFRSPRSTSRVALTATPTTMDWLRPFGATPTPGRSIRPASRPALAPCHVRLEPRDVSGHPRRGASPPGTEGGGLDCDRPRPSLYVGERVRLRLL
jgi:hypothetical protein